MEQRYTLLVVIPFVFVGLYLSPWRSFDKFGRRKTSNSSLVAVNESDIENVRATTPTPKLIRPRLDSIKSTSPEQLHTSYVSEAFQMWKLRASSFPDVLANLTPPSLYPSSPQYIPRVRRKKILGAEKVRRHFGLTNQMIFYASMMSYAVSDERDIVFPMDAEIPFYHLFDVEATQRDLMDAGIQIVNPSDMNGIRPSFFKKRVPLPRRELCVTNDEDAKLRAWHKVKRIFEESKDTQYVLQGDFYLRWPFGVQTTGPTMDLCYFLSRMHFPQQLREIAEKVIQAIGAKRILSVHLRLEPDAVLLLSSSQAVSAAAVKAHFISHVYPLAKDLNVGAIYVCSGKLKKEHLDAFHEVSSAHGIPIYSKQDFANIFQGVSEVRGKFGYGKFETTNHFGAAVDLMIIEASTAVVVSGYSSFALNVFARTCRRHSVGVFLHSITNQGTFTKILYSPCDRPLMFHCHHAGANKRPQYRSSTDYS